MKRINSRAKGQRGEREFRDVLRAAGYQARRGAQYSGHVEAPDVICNDLPDIHFEVKRVKKCGVYKYLEQALRDCKNIKYPTVVLKADDKPWITIRYTRDDLDILRRSDLPAVHSLNGNGHNNGEGLERATVARCSLNGTTTEQPN